MPRDENAPALIYTTFGTVKDAEKLGSLLIEARLAACVNIFPQIISLYVWKGKKQRDQEVAMLIKTRQSLVEQVLEAAKRHHPYETPALLVLDVTRSDADYCAWILGATSP